MSIESYNIVMTVTCSLGILMLWLSFYPENLHFLMDKVAPEEDDEFSILPGVGTLQTKLIIPLARKISKLTRTRLTRAKLEEAELILKASGRPYNITAIEYCNMGYAYAIFIFVVCAYVCIMIDFPIILAAVCALSGFSAPKQWLEKIAKERTEKAEMELPNILDLLSVCMSSGMTLLSALSVICENNEGILIDELTKIKNDINSGESLEHAFYELTLRIKSKRIELLYNNIKLSEEYGTPISDKLRLMSDTVRDDVFELTKQKAAKAAQYVLIPVVLFIFPAVGIVTFGPILARVILEG